MFRYRLHFRADTDEDVEHGCKLSRQPIEPVTEVFILISAETDVNMWDLFLKNDFKVCLHWPLFSDSGMLLVKIVVAF